MTEFRHQRRWAPLWAATIAVFVYALLALSVVHSMRLEEPVAIILPVLPLAAYLVLMLVVNSRRVVVRPDGVSVRNGPLPGGGKTRVRRDEIRHCYARNHRTYDDGREVDNFWMAGVESSSGQLVDAAGPFKSWEEADRTAKKIAAVLNAGGATPSINVRAPSGRPPANWRWKVRVLAWMSAFIAAVLAGAAFEISGPGR